MENRVGKVDVITQTNSTPSQKPLDKKMPLLPDSWKIETKDYFERINNLKCYKNVCVLFFHLLCFLFIYLLLLLTVLTTEEHLMPRSFPLVALWRHCLPPFSFSKAIGCNSSLPTSHRRFMLYNMHTHAWPVQWANWLPCHHDILQFLKKSCKGQRADSRRAGQSSSFSLVRVSVLIAIIVHSLMDCVV